MTTKTTSERLVSFWNQGGHFQKCCFGEDGFGIFGYALQMCSVADLRTCPLKVFHLCCVVKLCALLVCHLCEAKNDPKPSCSLLNWSVQLKKEKEKNGHQSPQGPITLSVQCLWGELMEAVSDKSWEISNNSRQKLPSLVTPWGS